MSRVRGVGCEGEGSSEMKIMRESVEAVEPIKISLIYFYFILLQLVLLIYILKSKYPKQLQYLFSM